MGSSEVWKRANEIIPGGNHLFSKTPLRYCPGKWPAYYSNANGITVMDLDGHTYQDFSVMGAGNSTLGYKDPDVDEAVIRAIDKGNVSTLNCREEVDLAESLLAINPHLDMVRFGRSGNDACQIALRIAREFSGRQKFAICGYHGWEVGHPPQLDPNCVPFEYGDADAAFNAIDINLGAVIMEPVRSKPVDIPFLRAVRDYTDDLGIPLIFDEIASGFRANFGGYHQTIQGLTPDIVCYGKAMGNGHAISAVVGRKEIMQAALKTFISSMFWSERIGYAAGLATLDKMHKVRSWEQISRKGKEVKEIWQQAARKAGMGIEVSGLDALATFNIKNDDDRRWITTFTQEMLKRGYLASNQFYPSVRHSPAAITEYGNHVEEVFEDIASGNVRLEGETAMAGFKRLV